MVFEKSYDIFYINSVEASNSSANSCQIGGCLDQNALNFDQDALLDNNPDNVH